MQKMQGQKSALEETRNRKVTQLTFLCLSYSFFTLNFRQNLYPFKAIKLNKRKYSASENYLDQIVKIQKYAQI